MAHFSGKIINAYYTNSEHNTVCVMWSDGELAREHYVVVDENDTQFQELLEEWSYDSLDQATQQFNDNVSQEFKDAFERYAIRNNLYGYSEDGSVPRPQDDDEVLRGDLETLILNFDEENTEQKEQLFKLKLKLFEEDVVKSSKKRTAKTDLRKAETPVEAIAAYAKFL
jgi:hypothetical protein|tara:strand:- start:68 stop:574 length:507 start_codon:yes stop_codon:yes gene_type:complete